MKELISNLEIQREPKFYLEKTRKSTHSVIMVYGFSLLAQTVTEILFKFDHNVYIEKFKTKFPSFADTVSK